MENARKLEPDTTLLWYSEPLEYTDDNKIQDMTLDLILLFPNCTPRHHNSQDSAQS